MTEKKKERKKKNWTQKVRDEIQSALVALHSQSPRKRIVLNQSLISPFLPSLVMMIMKRQTEMRISSFVTRRKWGWEAGLSE